MSIFKWFHTKPRKILGITALLIIGIIILANVLGSNPNQQTCHDYWTLHTDIDQGNYAQGAKDLQTLDNDQPTNPQLKTAVSTFTQAFNTNDSALASNASYVIGGLCDGMGYGN